MIVVSVASVGGTSTVAAHDHRAPGVVLRAAGERQPNRPYELWWTRPDGGGGCVSWNKIRERTFPEPLVVPAEGGKARIRLKKKHAPTSFQLRRWQVHAQAGVEVVGEAETVPVRAKRVRREGTTRVWDLVFERQDQGRFHYELFVEWEDKEGCGGAQGGRWTFHLATE